MVDPEQQIFQLRVIKKSVPSDYRNCLRTLFFIFMLNKIRSKRKAGCQLSSYWVSDVNRLMRAKEYNDC